MLWKIIIIIEYCRYFSTSSINCPCFIAMLHCLRVIDVCFFTPDAKLLSLLPPSFNSPGLSYPCSMMIFRADSCWAPKAYWLLSPCLLCKLISPYRNWFASWNHHGSVKLLTHLLMNFWTCAVFPPMILVINRWCKFNKSPIHPDSWLSVQTPSTNYRWL